MFGHNELAENSKISLKRESTWMRIDDAETNHFFRTRKCQWWEKTNVWFNSLKQDSNIQNKHEAFFGFLSKKFSRFECQSFIWVNEAWNISLGKPFEVNPQTTIVISPPEGLRRIRCRKLCVLKITLQIIICNILLRERLVRSLFTQILGGN